MTSSDNAAPTASSERPDASVGQRVGAILLDTVLAMLPLYVVAGILFGDSQAGAGSAGVQLTGVPFLLTTLVAFAYFFVLELMTGQTLGKKIVGIRVVSDRGGAASAGQVLIRTALRIVDGFAFYLVGFITALVSKKNQRVGDMAASTRVVKAR